MSKESFTSLVLSFISVFLIISCVQCHTPEPKPIPKPVPSDSSLALPDEDLETIDPEYMVKQMSVVCWVKMPQGGGIVGHDQTVMAHWEDSAGTNRRKWVMGEAGSSGRMRVLIDQNGDRSSIKHYVSSYLAFDDTWHMIGFGFSKNSLKLYIDGQIDQIPSMVEDDPVDELFPNEVEPITVGALRATHTFKAEGLLGDCSIFSTQLTEPEVLILYKKGRNGDLSPFVGLKHWWKMESIPVKDEIAGNDIIAK